jgi:hypothetical protein
LSRSVKIDIKMRHYYPHAPESLTISYRVAAPASMSEGLPNVVMEAMAAGAPVVANAVGGTTALVIDGVTGFLASPAYADALERRIHEALSYPEWSARMAAQGRRRVLSQFSMRRMIESAGCRDRNAFGQPEVGCNRVCGTICQIVPRSKANCGGLSLHAIETRFSIPLDPSLFADHPIVAATMA